jgi:cytochrome d ubiquinol oxidase subunit II
VLTLVLFAFLAAVFLTLESHDPELCEDFRRRALITGIVLFFAAGVVLLLSMGGKAPLMHQGLLGSRWAVPLHLATAAAAIAVLAALWYRHYRLARAAVGAQVSLIVWGWALAQYPYLLPPDFTVQNSASPEATLRLGAIARGVGAVVLVPSLVYLFRVFKSGPADLPGAGH